MTVEWKDVTSYDRRENLCVQEARSGELCIAVHKHIQHGDQWLVTCRQLGIDRVPLKTTEIEEAKAVAIDFVILTARAHLANARALDR